MGLMLAFSVGLSTGILSGFGVGGGTLLMIYLTAFAGFSQHAAQGINLIYFLPCSIAALISHLKNHLVETKALLPAIAAGCVTTLLASLAATSTDQSILRKFFGAFLLCIGIYELLRKQKK